MTRDEILQMAKQAGLPIRTDPMQRGCTHSEIVRFAKKVAQLATTREREACAKVCDDIYSEFLEVEVMQCSKAIRARGEKSNNGDVKE